MRRLDEESHTAGLRITTYAKDPANSVHQLVTGSRRALADLSATRARWHHATRPAPAIRTPAAHAGPRPPPTSPATTARNTR
ncbi:hypothetical protein ACFYT4_35220 [Streptomyces sp. NPDC004609]|uniref:hypothetical protein n=1 Tax=Streptomyces sp. NPDC004609 TaxID=3364704 RepID=UPI0036C09F3F